VVEQQIKMHQNRVCFGLFFLVWRLLRLQVAYGKVLDCTGKCRIVKKVPKNQCLTQESSELCQEIFSHRCRKMISAAFLSSGWFSFPHLGEYIHEGQPPLHSQFSRSCSVFSQSGLMFK
jgi:hypothetical protein